MAAARALITTRALQAWMAAVCMVGLVACSAPPVQTVVAAAPAPVAAARALPPGDDWRSLLPVPFGSTVSQIPFALKEVLLFQGENRNANESDEAECYSKSGVPLTFRGIQADDYVLCFVHDRLFRVETVLRLPKDVPADTFSHWCDEWLTGLNGVDRNADHCEGRDNDTTLLAGMTYDTEIAGPLVTVLVVDQPTRDLLEPRKTTQP
jgi:hypothetical protein